MLVQVLHSTWEMTCSTYRNGCDEHGSCVADYDVVEGIVMASTSSSDLVAGSTSVAAVVSIAPDGGDVLHLLHCGDSRAVLAGKPREKAFEREKRISRQSFVHFSTRDHSPSCDNEAERLRRGIEAGFDYTLPECSLSRWWLTVGDYQYAVSRSLEGNVATSKGIVSDADLTSIELPDVLAEREHVTLVLASDGLFEVIDNEEVSRELVTMREAGFSATDAAKNLVGLAMKKGTSDNVSVVVIYFN